MFGRRLFCRVLLLSCFGTARAEPPVVFILNVRNRDRDIPFWDDRGTIAGGDVLIRGDCVPGMGGGVLISRGRHPVLDPGGLPR